MVQRKTSHKPHHQGPKKYQSLFTREINSIIQGIHNDTRQEAMRVNGRPEPPPALIQQTTATMQFEFRRRHSVGCFGIKNKGTIHLQLLSFHEYIKKKS
jgi:hypothetical protein